MQTKPTEDQIKRKRMQSVLMSRQLALLAKPKNVLSKQ